MTGVEGEKFRKPKEEKKPLLTEEEEEILFGELSTREKHDKFTESLTAKEKTCVKEYRDILAIKHSTIKEIERAEKLGDPVAERKAKLILEKILPKIELLYYERMYSTIKATALENIGLGPGLAEEAKKIFKQKTKIYKLLGEGLPDLISRFPAGLSKSYVETYAKGMIETKEEISLREAVNRVEARLFQGSSQEEISKYNDYKKEYFKGRIRLSRAMKLEEDWYKK